MLLSYCLTASLYHRSSQTGCVISGIIILSVGSVSKLLMMHALVKVPGWYQDLPWIHTWDGIHLLKDDYWVHTLDIQRCDDTLYWTTLSLGSTSLRVRWRLPCHVSCHLFSLRLVARKATCSALLRSYVLIWHAVSVFSFALGGP